LKIVSRCFWNWSLFTAKLNIEAQGRVKGELSHPQGASRNFIRKKRVEENLTRRKIKMLSRRSKRN
jgi:hypothetical protein